MKTQWKIASVLSRGIVSEALQAEVKIKLNGSNVEPYLNRRHFI